MTILPNDRSLVRLPEGLALQDPDDRVLLLAKLVRARTWLAGRASRRRARISTTRPRLALVR